MTGRRNTRNDGGFCHYEEALVFPVLSLRGGISVPIFVVERKRWYSPFVIARRVATKQSFMKSEANLLIKIKKRLKNGETKKKLKKLKKIEKVRSKQLDLNFVS